MKSDNDPLKKPREAKTGKYIDIPGPGMYNLSINKERHMNDDNYQEHIQVISDWMTRYYQKNNPNKRRSKQNYQAIAERYLVACSKIVFANAGKTIKYYNNSHNLKINLQTLRTMVPDEIMISGKAEYWAYILRDKFPVWQVVNLGRPGELSQVRIIHNDLWRSIMNNNISERLWDEHQIITHLQDTYEKLQLEHMSDNPDIQEIPIDIKNLDNAITHYVKWYDEAYLENNTDRMDKVVRMIAQAKNISQAVKALNTEGATKNQCLPHFPVTKNYRTYYLGGLNLQNCLSEVRHAALGRCHSYDLRSSVYTFYADLCETEGLDNYYIKQYALNTQAIRQSLAAIIKPYVGKANAEKIIKHYITAMGFGATQTQGYTDVNGDYQNSALSDILKHPDARAELGKSEIIQGIQTEIAQILDHIRANIGVDKQIKWKQKHNTSRYSPRKHLCEMYTDWESCVMGKITEYISDRHPDHKILLQIHDCMYVSHKLDTVSIHDVLKLEHISKYARLSHTELDTYHNLDEYDRYEQENSEHTERIASEEALAKNYHSTNNMIEIDTQTANKPTPKLTAGIDHKTLHLGEMLNRELNKCTQAQYAELWASIESDCKLLNAYQAYQSEKTEKMLSNIEFSQEHGEYVNTQS